MAAGVLCLFSYATPSALARAMAVLSIITGAVVMPLLFRMLGEARDADVALCGGDGFFMLFEKGRMVRRVEEGDAVRVVIESVAAMRENLRF